MDHPHQSDCDPMPFQNHRSPRSTASFLVKHDDLPHAKYQHAFHSRILRQNHTLTFLPCKKLGLEYSCNVKYLRLRCNPSYNKHPSQLGTRNISLSMIHNSVNIRWENGLCVVINRNCWICPPKKCLRK